MAKELVEELFEVCCLRGAVSAGRAEAVLYPPAYNALARKLLALPTLAEVDAALLHLQEALGADVYLGISQHEAGQRAFIAKRLAMIEPLLRRLKGAVG